MVEAKSIRLRILKERSRAAIGNFDLVEAKSIRLRILKEMKTERVHTFTGVEAKSIRLRILKVRLPIVQGVERKS